MTVVRLTWPADADRVLDLGRRSADYLAMDIGRPADAAWVRDEFTEPPPGREAADLIHYGLNGQAGRLAGFSTCVRGYRVAAEWFLGLMLLGPAHRGQGHGRTLLSVIETAARADGAETLRLVVLPQNARGRAFWEREGFRMDGLSDPPPGAPQKPIMVKAL